MTPKSQKRDTQTSPNILRQDIDKIKSPEKENYYVVKEKVPQNDDFEALLDFYFADERRVELEAFAMNLHISIEQMRVLARSCVNEWQLNNHRHQNRQDAVKHLTNHIRAKALKEPPPPVLPVEERRAQLWEEIKQAADEIIATNGDCALTADDCTQFYNYWIELNNAGTKMRFEIQPFFTTTNRLRSWIAGKDTR
ncbi:MAG: hypothetical protein K2K08_05630 [Paramuribaculum sp.]|nr:hypothetical protein [Paramuribaculum sp.]